MGEIDNLEPGVAGECLPVQAGQVVQAQVHLPNKMQELIHLKSR